MDGDRNYNIIPGKYLAGIKKQFIYDTILENKLAPKLAIIQVGDDAASTIYTTLKSKEAKKLGMLAVVYRLPSGSEKELINLVDELNKSADYSGIMIQSPPAGILENKCLEIYNSIDQNKDVDGMGINTLNWFWQQKSFAINNSKYIPATVLSVLDSIYFVARQKHQTKLSLREIFNPYEEKDIEILREYLTGKNIIIINRSIIIGKPLAAILLSLDSTVTIAHSKSKDLKNIIRSADIIVSGTGVAGFLSTSETNAEIIIDAGISKQKDGSVKGDFSEVYNEKTFDSQTQKYYSQVPGGLGPLTVSNLLFNTLKSELNLSK